MDNAQKHALIVGGVGIAAIAAVFYIIAARNVQVPAASATSALPVDTSVPAADAQTESQTATPSYVNYNVAPYDPALPSVQNFMPASTSTSNTGCCPGCAGGDGGVMNNSVNNYYAVSGYGAMQGSAA